MTAFSINQLSHPQVISPLLSKSFCCPLSLKPLWRPPSPSVSSISSCQQSSFDRPAALRRACHLLSSFMPISSCRSFGSIAVLPLVCSYQCCNIIVPIGYAVPLGCNHTREILPCTIWALRGVGDLQVVIKRSAFQKYLQAGSSREPQT
ncbi:hypothetical protein M407DRAFT_103687 [Tulasnella calospora MUT 4182]|uniref:Uncharacterized protein n=1 Tax=Tulasnella calospora MUT 4182 TaxID=1051891 RepID=A0A0C3L0W1_9AGAM|nr:hypothetical protein M407DRAFT_103687 [Tulasnella calospora MUT 4182]